MDLRVAALEISLSKVDAKIDRIDAALARREPAIREMGNRSSDLLARTASVEGQLKAMPSVVQLFIAMISTWAAGAAIVFALLKAVHP